MANFRVETPEICLAAVSQNGNALFYGLEQTPEICRPPLRQTLSAARDVRIKWKSTSEDFDLLDVLENLWNGGRRFIEVD